MLSREEGGRSIHHLRILSWHGVDARIEKDEPGQRLTCLAYCFHAGVYGTENRRVVWSPGWNSHIKAWSMENDAR